MTAIGNWHERSQSVKMHRHAWGQAVFSDTGIIRVSTPDSAFVVPARHAVWIPPDIDHAAILLQNARLFSIYVLAEKIPSDTDRPGRWTRGKVIKVTPLLFELVRKLAALAGRESGPDYRNALFALIETEFFGAPESPLGLPLPEDRRLRRFCELFLVNPRQDRDIRELAKLSGASVSTISRLFKSELGLSFSQWRQLALLTSALELAAEGLPMKEISARLGYGDPSAFSTMVSKLTGVPPSLFLYPSEKA